MATKKVARAAKPALLDAAGFGRSAAQATQRDATASWLAIDLDDLLSLNRDVGHAAGDRFIGAAAGVLTRAAREYGWTVGRVGGDEFAVLLPGIPLEQAFL